ASIDVRAGATLDAASRADGTLTLTAGQTLKGNGTILGKVVAAPGSIVAPGASVGALTFSNALTLQGTNIMELDKAGHTNDLIICATNITFGGTLSLSIVGGSLANGDSFKLFQATSFLGGFTNIVPVIPGAGLAWDTSSLLIDGTLKVTY